MNSNKENTEEPYYYKLFKFFVDQYNITLLDSEIQEIINEVDEFNSSKINDNDKIIEELELNEPLMDYQNTIEGDYIFDKDKFYVIHFGSKFLVLKKN